LFHPTESLWLAAADRLSHPPPPPAPEIDSLIVSEFPPLFEDFRAKCFNLLWRGSRDGFGAKEFHRRCDGRANTLTLILDTNGNIFGGFTPVEWESRTDSPYKGDDSRRHFLFTLRSPCGVPLRKFALKVEGNYYAICCYSECGPMFGDGCISVCDNCNRNTRSKTVKFGVTCNSVSEGDTKDFLTGSHHFRVKEIEVFEIAD
jgi:hypothetical protein